MKLGTNSGKTMLLYLTGSECLFRIPKRHSDPIPKLANILRTALPALAAVAATTFNPVTTQTAHALSCGAGRSEVTIHAGVNPSVKNLPPRLGLSGASTASLKGVTLQWLPTDADARICDAESTTTNYLTEEQGGVGLYHGRTGGSTPDIAKAELLPTSDFTHGQLDIAACMPDEMRDGLLFPIYGTADKSVGFQVNAFTVRDGIATSVTNEGTTNNIGLEFNTTGADQIVTNIEGETGVDVPRCLAENLFQETIPLQARGQLASMALLNNPTDGIIYEDKFIVTGDNAAAYAPHGVEAVFDGNTNVLSSGRVTNLDNKIDSTEHVGAVTERVKTYADRTITLLEGRPDQTMNVGECDANDNATITSHYTHKSTLDGTITLLKNGTEIRSATDNLNTTVSCDGGTYQIVADRKLDGVTIPAWTSNPYTRQSTTQPQYNISVFINVQDNGTSLSDTTHPTAETIKTIWDLSDNDLALMTGTREYICEQNPDAIVNTLDEIATNYNGSTSATKDDFTNNQTATFEKYMNDADFDGSVCDSDEPDGAYLNLIKLTITLK